MSALEIVAAALILAGAIVVSIAGLGVARLPDPFMRMHAATKAGIVGSGLILLGAGLSFGAPAPILTAVFAIVFLLATAPIASHALGRSAYVAGAPLSAALARDALEGTLRRAAPRRVATSTTEEEIMSALSPHDLFAASGRPADLRRVALWIAPGPHQEAATGAALRCASAHGATLLAVSAAGLGAASPRGGPGEERRRTAGVLKALEAAAAKAGVRLEGVHEERDWTGLATALAGQDLLICPAAAAPSPQAGPFTDEIAASLCRTGLAPTLRVREDVAAVRRVLLPLVDPGICRNLAHRFIRGGLWPSAAITVLPLADYRMGMRALAEEQAALLRAHGRTVEIAASPELDFDPAALAAFAQRFDAAIMSRLSFRIGWIGAVRPDLQETCAANTAQTLLP